MRRLALGRLLRTLRHLRAEQLAGQLQRALGPRRRPLRLAGPPPRLGLEAPAVAYLPAPAHARWDGGGRVRLLNREVPFANGIDWDFAGEGPLWAYHLHQFDWARDPDLDPGARLRALADWVARHRQGVGWDPGPTSLRTFAWLKLLTTPGALADDAEARRTLLASLAAQVAGVDARPERHLLGNHYLWNLLALVAAGVALAGPAAERWLRRGPELAAELEEQVLPDGAHYERSPMYHALLLENVLDLVNLARCARGRLAPDLEALLCAKAARMLGALQVWTHPDGEIALFGDSALGIAHPPPALHRYAAALGIATRAPDPPGLLAAAGFVRLVAGPFVLLVTAAAPMPPHQPGHAHCDALSFELSVGGERVVTDTGVTEYVPGPLRDAARATRSHATVEIDGREQAETWAAHRVGGRPHVALVSAHPPKRAEAECAGWATPGVRHRRAFEVEPSGVTLRDTFTSAAPRARLVLPLAPGLEAELREGRARIPLAGGRALRVALPAQARWRVERAPYFPEFGRRLERAALVGEAAHLAEALWQLRLD